MDFDPHCGADIIHDLDVTPWPLDESSFDELHAYEVLEHLGAQGDFHAFFRHFGEIYRVLKPGGHLFATCPSYRSPWAWGDPSHRRIINACSITFLSQRQYDQQVGKTSMTDFRRLWSGDFELVFHEDDGETFSFVMKAVKDR